MIRPAATIPRAARTPMTIPAMAPCDILLDAFGRGPATGSEVGVVTIVCNIVLPSCVCVTTLVTDDGGSVTVFVDCELDEELVEVEGLEVGEELEGGGGALYSLED